MTVVTFRGMWLLVLALVVSNCAEIAVAQSAPPSGQAALKAILARRGFVKIGIPGRSGTFQMESQSGRVAGPGGQGGAYSEAVSVTAAGGVLTASAGGRTIVSGNELMIVPAEGYFATGGKQYRGRALLTGWGSNIQFINELQIDDWLKGVLPAEIGANSHPEAMKAQAVTGRSEAIFRLKKPPHDSEGYDFCTGVHCQAYKGMSVETDKSNRACDETLGVVLLDGDGEVVNAVYHNVCGGVTAAADDVWEGGPVAGLTPVFDKIPSARPSLSTDSAMRVFLSGDGQDYFCWPGNPDYANYAKKYFRWEKSYTGAQLARMSGVGKVRSIEVTERRPSGRVRKLTVVGDRGSKTTEKELPIRNQFDLWSGLFIMDVTMSGGYVSQVTFRGAGNGHGVGLCQHGAREIARRGGKFEQILKHYYPMTRAQKIYRP